MADSDVTNAVAGRINKYVEWDWVSGAAGQAYSQDSVIEIDGVIVRAVFIPDGGGTAPTDLYDVTLTDDKSVDVLQGFGANRSGTSTNNVNFSGEYQTTVSSLLTLGVANAGNSKGGIVRVYYRAVA